MTIKELIINFVIILIGITIICLGIGYIWWFHDYIIKTNPKVNFINVILVSLGYIVPTLILFGSGLIIFIGTLMDPWKSD